MFRRFIIGGILLSMMCFMAAPALASSPEATLKPYIPSEEEMLSMLDPVTDGGSSVQSSKGTDASGLTPYVPDASETVSSSGTGSGTSGSGTSSSGSSSSSLLLPETPHLPVSSKNYKLVVNLTSQIVTAYGKDSSGAYTVPVRYMLCTTGAKETPTPTGSFELSSRYRWFYFDEFKVWAQFATRIYGGILFHSVLYTDNKESTLKTSSVSRLGSTGSHGCIRLTVKDAKWIYDNCPKGTSTSIVNGEKQSELAAALKKQISNSAQREVVDNDKSDNLYGYTPSQLSGSSSKSSSSSSSGSSSSSKSSSGSSSSSSSSSSSGTSKSSSGTSSGTSSSSSASKSSGSTSGTSSSSSTASDRTRR